jgi:hypothetical protein
MDHDHRSAALGHAGFDATRWSVVLEAAKSRAAGGPEALARLCERYWPPLYAFARHRGFSPEDAQDLVQGFFEHLIESRAWAQSTKPRGASDRSCWLPFKTLLPWSAGVQTPKSGAAAPR